MVKRTFEEIINSELVPSLQNSGFSEEAQKIFDFICTNEKSRNDFLEFAGVSEGDDEKSILDGLYRACRKLEDNPVAEDWIEADAIEKFKECGLK